MSNSTEGHSDEDCRVLLDTLGSLMDFYDAWPTLRPLAIAVSEDEHLSREERDTVAWLSKLADRITKLDLG